MDSGEGVERAIERAYSYEKAGADVVLPISREEEELLNFAKGWDGSIPIITGPTVFPNRSADFWGEAGYSIVIYSVHVLQAAIFAMDEFLQGLQETRGFKFSVSKLTPFDVMVNYIGLAELIELEKEFLPS
jgi:phosphoenolpyruvate phosphomutase